MDLIHYSHSGEKAGTMMHFGGNIGEVRESLFGIASSERHIKRQDGEEQKDEPPRNGALSISSLKERIEEGGRSRCRKECQLQKRITT